MCAAGKRGRMSCHIRWVLGDCCLICLSLKWDCETMGHRVLSLCHWSTYCHWVILMYTPILGCMGENKKEIERK